MRDERTSFVWALWWSLCSTTTWTGQDGYLTLLCFHYLSTSKYRGQGFSPRPQQINRRNGEDTRDSWLSNFRCNHLWRLLVHPSSYHTVTVLHDPPGYTSSSPHHPFSLTLFPVPLRTPSPSKEDTNLSLSTGTQLFIFSFPLNYSTVPDSWS